GSDPSETIEQHFRIVRPSGEVRSLRIRLGSVRSAEGIHVGWSATFEDITDALRDAEALRSATRQQEGVAALGLLALGGTSRESLFDEAVARTREALGAATVQILTHGIVAAGAISASIHDTRLPTLAIAATPREGCLFEAGDLHFLQAVANVLSAFIQRERLDARAKRRERW